MILADIAWIDAMADARAFSEQEWAHRYDLEGQVEASLRAEEEYWRRRSGLKWVLKGDANTKYFQAYANGRHRKCSILRLQSEQGLLLRQEDISRHIYEFYISLMGTCEARGRASVRTFGRTRSVYWTVRTTRWGSRSCQKRLTQLFLV